MTDHVTVTRMDEVLLVRFARPEKKNALTGAMYERLVEIFSETDAAGEVGAIVLAGSGGSFTAGNDIADFLAYAHEPGLAPPFRFLEALARLETPLVAAVEGVAVGVGTTLLLHCDLAFAAPDARFRMPFVDLGVVPEAGSSLLLPQRVGLAKASELLLLAEPFDAAEALRLGLLNAVVPSQDLLDRAMDCAHRLAAKPRSALRTTRQLLRGDRGPVLAAIRTEAEAFRAALASPDAQAALHSFLARSKPATT